MPDDSGYAPTRKVDSMSSLVADMVLAGEDANVVATAPHRALDASVPLPPPAPLPTAFAMPPGSVPASAQPTASLAPRIASQAPSRYGGFVAVLLGALVVLLLVVAVLVGYIVG